MSAEGGNKAVLKAKRLVPFDFLLGRTMDRRRMHQIPLLVEQPSRQLLPPLVPHRPWCCHAMRRPHDRDALRFCKPAGFMQKPTPQTMDMDNIALAKAVG